MSAPELRAVEHYQWLHAHFQGQSRDCDGPMSYGHTTWLAALTEGVIEDSPKARDDFEALLLHWSVSFTDPPTQLEAGMNDDGEPYISYYCQTEEGYESGRWDLCRDRFCHEDEAAGPWQRDHFAEAAGY